MTKKQDPNKLNWYIAYVKANQERKAAEVLARMGQEYYLPIQREVRRWSDRNKIVERLVIPRLIFIRCRECERIPLAEKIWQIYGYMSNGGPYNPAIVRDIEMENFRAMVEHSGRSVSMATSSLAVGDHVKVTSGPLAGMVCELVQVDGARCLAVRLGALGTATMDIALDTVEKVEVKEN